MITVRWLAMLVIDQRSTVQGRQITHHIHEYNDRSSLSDAHAALVSQSVVVKNLPS